VRLLALEAGGPVLGAALFEGGEAMASAHLLAPQRQAESLAPMVQALLQGQHWPVASLHAVACGLGPGSFTGLRSSLAFGRGLQLGNPRLKLAGVPTLHAWAEAFSPLGVDEIRVLLDGRRGQVYRARLQRVAGDWQERLPSALLDLTDALQEAAADAAPLLCDLAPERLAPLVSLPVELDSAALVLAVGRLAMDLLKAETLPDWEPLYLRRSEAEILWDKLHPKP